MNHSGIRFIHPEKDKAIFFATLRKRVDAYFKDNHLSKHYNASMIIKTIVLLGAYVLPFLGILFIQPSFGLSMLLWSMMGFAMAGIGMSIMHDANHGAYSSSSKTNYWLGHTLNLLGASAFNWKMQHNFLHHTYTNIVQLDDDIADKLFFRFSPHTKVKWYHRFQFLYAFLFYGILTLYWVTLKDFVQFRKYAQDKVNTNSTNQNRFVFLKIFLSKLIYFTVFLVVPVYIFGLQPSHVVLGFLLMHFIGGIILTVIFQLAHTVERTSYPLPNNDKVIENVWAIHQLNTTVNFSRKNKFLSWYLGGLNYQVEHHLFPSICHVHYPAISEIVKSTCGEFKVPYLENETFLQALISHIKALKRFGQLPSRSDAIA